MNVILILLAGISSFCCQADAASAPPDVPASAAICGPRCIDYLLKYYGKPSPGVTEIVLAVQPEISKGMSVDSMAGFLLGAEINTKLVLLDGLSGLSVTKPAVICQDNKDSEIGHFSILLPSVDTQQLTIWDGDGGSRLVPVDELVRRSRFVLLTDDSKSPSYSYVARKKIIPYSKVLLGVSLIFLLCLFFRSVLRRPTFY